MIKILETVWFDQAKLNRSRVFVSPNLQQNRFFICWTTVQFGWLSLLLLFAMIAASNPVSGNTSCNPTLSGRSGSTNIPCHVTISHRLPNTLSSVSVCGLRDFQSASNLPTAGLGTVTMPAKPPSPQSLQSVETLSLATLQPFFNRFGQFQARNRVLLVGLFICLVLIFVIEQLKRRARKSDGNVFGLTRIAQNTRRVSYLSLLLIVMLGGWLVRTNSDLQESRQTVKRLDKKLDQMILGQYQDAFERDVSENPIPIKPLHPPRLGGQYFRGNDERSPQLFNGGFYRTAGIRVFLADQNKNELAWESVVELSRFFIGVEIERAANATPALFTVGIMDTVFLTRQTAAETNSQLDEPIHFEMIEEQQRWVAYYPISLEASEMPPAGNPTVSSTGMVFLFVGDSQATPIQAICHYGIQFDIRVADNQISKTSEIWMGPVYMPKKAVIPRPESMTLSQWFDFRPIPIVNQQNTTDPKLLGIDDYDQ